jgi:hypothetical protein
MSKTLESIFRKHRMKHLCQVKRHPQGLCKTSGFVVDVSESLILLQRCDWDTFEINGYSVIRSADIESYRFFDKSKWWQFRAVQHFKLQPKAPAGISVSSLPALLASAARIFPLLTIHREKINSKVCYIGKLTEGRHKTFTIADLNCNAEWTGSRRLKYSDVSLVDFGGGYENALAATAPKRK